MNTAPKLHTVIQPSRSYQPLRLRELWEFRDLLLTLGLRDITLRYRQTVLGVAWVMLQPLLAAAIFAIVFGRVAHLSSDGTPYFVYAFAGLVIWNLFSTVLTRSSASLVMNSALVSKVFFPRLILPLSSAFSALLDFAVSLGAALIIMALHGMWPTLAVLLLPIPFLIALILALGIGLFCAAWMAVYRDIQQIIPVFVPLLMYASPVAYAIASVPHSMRAFYVLNPLTGILEMFRWTLFGHGTVIWPHVLYSACASLVIFTVGIFDFKRVEKRLADVI